MKGFIFDLDGTLLDSLDMWRNIDIEYMAKSKYIPCSHSIHSPLANIWNF